MLEESASAVPSSLWASMNSWFTPTVLFVILNLMIGTIALTSTLTNQRNHNSSSGSNHHTDSQDDDGDARRPHLAQPPSVLQRLRSFNFRTHFRSTEALQNFPLHQKQSPDSDTLFHVEHTNQALETQSHYFFQDITTCQENLEVTQPEAHYIFQHNLRESWTHPVSEEKGSDLDDFQQGHELKNAKDELSGQKMEGVDNQMVVTGSHFSRTRSDTEPTSGEVPAKLPAKMRKSASFKSAFGHFKEEDVVEARRPETVRERTSNARVTDGDEGVDAKADDFINRFKKQLKLQLDSIIKNRGGKQ